MEVCRLMTLVVAPILLGFGATAGLPKTSDFSWLLARTGERRSLRVEDIPETGTYSIRLRLALTGKAENGSLSFVADGVEFINKGDGVFLRGHDEGLVNAGRMQDPGFQFSLRNRRYHDLVFIVGQDDIVFHGDGDEKRPVAKPREARRGFELVAEGVDIDVRGLEIVPHDMTKSWTYGNQLVNGGFEETVNGYPSAWSTAGFGFQDLENAVHADLYRTGYRIEDSCAFEGKHSFFLQNHTPLWECIRKRWEKTDYVFSVYARATTPKAKLKLMSALGYETITSEVFSVGTEWRRLELKFNSGHGNSLRCGMALAEGAVLVDAAQLERGTQASDFSPRPMPCEEPTENPPKVMCRYFVEQAPTRAPSGRPPRSSRVNPEHNCYRVNGRDFFAYGFYCCMKIGKAELPLYCQLLDQFKSKGLNFVELAGHHWSTDPEVLRQMLNEAEARGVKTMLHVEYDVRNRRLDPAQSAAVKAVSDHDNLIGVDLMDEAFGSGRADLAEHIRIAEAFRRELGVDLPIKFNEFDLAVLKRMDYSAAADIASVDFYPVGNHEISCTYYLLKQLAGDNPDCLVTFNPMAAGHFMKDWPRDATPAEVVAQAYCGFVLDIFCINWWMMCPLSSATMDAVVQVKREMDLINPEKFLEGIVYPVICRSRNDAIKFSARRTGDAVTIIAVNIENRPNTAEWEVPDAPRTAVSLFEPFVGNVDGSRIRDVFPALARRVYVFGLGPK